MRVFQNLFNKFVVDFITDFGNLNYNLIISADLRSMYSSLKVPTLTMKYYWSADKSVLVGR